LRSGAALIRVVGRQKTVVQKHRVKALDGDWNALKQKPRLSVLPAHERNSPTQIMQKGSGRLTDRTQGLDRDYYYYYYYYYLRQLIYVDGWWSPALWCVECSVDISCTFELGFCGWVGNWTHNTDSVMSSRVSRFDPCKWLHMLSSKCQVCRCFPI